MVRRIVNGAAETHFSVVRYGALGGIDSVLLVAVGAPDFELRTENTLVAEVGEVEMDLGLIYARVAEQHRPCELFVLDLNLTQR